MGSTSVWGFSDPNLVLVFLNLLFLGTCIIFLPQVLGLSLSLFFPVIFLYLILGYLVTTEIRFFALKSKKEKGTGKRSERFLMCGQQQQQQIIMSRILTTFSPFVSYPPEYWTTLLYRVRVAKYKYKIFHTWYGLKFAIP